MPAMQPEIGIGNALRQQQDERTVQKRQKPRQPAEMRVQKKQIFNVQADQEEVAHQHENECGEDPVGDLIGWFSQQHKGKKPALDDT